MDDKASILIHTVFIDKLTTKDIYVIFKKLFNIEPLKTIFVQSNDVVFIDFIYSDDKSASRYLNLQVQEVNDHITNKIAIIHEITNLSCISSDIDTYIDSSPVLKQFLKYYKRNKRTINRKAILLESQRKVLKSKGIDATAYDFIKDAI